MRTHLFVIVSLVSAALLSSGCATAKLAGPPVVIAPDPGVARTVVLEPFFESAVWQTNYKTEYAQVMNPYSSGFGYGGGYGPNSTVAIQRQVNEKTLFARVPVLNEEHRQLIAAVQRARPNWRVTSTSGAPVLTGPVSIVRVIIHDAELVESNRTFKNLAFAFGLLIWPLELVNINPVEETQRVYGNVVRYDTDGSDLKNRLVRYETQPDFAINTNALPPLDHTFGLDIAYTEGLLANEQPRDGVLIDGFIRKLTAAVVAIVEEPPPRAQPPGAPPPAPASAPEKR